MLTQIARAVICLSAFAFNAHAVPLHEAAATTQVEQIERLAPSSARDLLVPAEPSIPTWRVPGTDPCRANVRCSGVWTLHQVAAHRLFPDQVVMELFESMQNDTPYRTRVATGDRLAFNTGGNQGRGEPNFFSGPILVDFSKTALAADTGLTGEAYSVEYNGHRYELIYVAACGNWVGRVTTLATPAATAPPLYVGGFGYSRGFGYFGGGGIGSLVSGSIVNPDDDDEDIIVVVPPDEDDKVTPIPLPAGVWLLLTALAGLGFCRKRHN